MDPFDDVIDTVLQNPMGFPTSDPFEQQDTSAESLSSIDEKDQQIFDSFEMFTTQKRKRSKTRVACTLCYQKKAKCDKERPCGNCVKHGWEDLCEDRVHKRRGSQKVVDRRTNPIIGKPDFKVIRRFSTMLQKTFVEECRRQVATRRKRDEYPLEMKHRVQLAFQRLIIKFVKEEEWDNLCRQFEDMGFPIRVPFAFEEQLSRMDYAEKHFKRRLGDNFKVAAIEMRCYRDGAQSNQQKQRKFIFCSKQAETLFGILEEEIVEYFSMSALRLKRQNVHPQPLFSKLIYEGDWESFVQLYAQAWMNEEPPRFREIRVITDDGHLRKCLVSCQIVVDSEKDLCRWCFYPIPEKDEDRTLTSSK